MTQKLDYYKVLGLERTASADEIKRAHQKLVMKFHPDRMINKSAEEKAAGEKKFAEIAEAANVLTDAAKRKVYDDHGHEGLARHASGNTPSARPNYADVAGPATKREMMTEEGLFDFFDKRRERAADTGAAGSFDRSNAAEERRRNREARRAASDTTPAAPAPAPRMPADDFDAVRNSVAKTGERLAQVNHEGCAQVPLDKLEEFRDAVRGMLAVLDDAIARTPKNNDGGPRR